MKKIISLLIICALLSLTGCGGRKAVNTEETTEETNDKYKQDAKDLDEDAFYVLKGNKYYPVYYGEASFSPNNSKATSSSDDRTLYFMEDWDKIPTLYEGDELIYHTSENLDETFVFERFEDYGYSIGISNLIRLDSGRYAFDAEEGDDVLGEVALRRCLRTAIGVHGVRGRIGQVIGDDGIDAVLVGQPSAERGVAHELARHVHAVDGLLHGGIGAELGQDGAGRNHARDGDAHVGGVVDDGLKLGGHVSGSASAEVKGQGLVGVRHTVVNGDVDIVLLDGELARGKNLGASHLGAGDNLVGEVGGEVHHSVVKSGLLIDAATCELAQQLGRGALDLDEALLHVVLIDGSGDGLLRGHVECVELRHLRDVVLALHRVVRGNEVVGLLVGEQALKRVVRSGNVLEARAQEVLGVDHAKGLVDKLSHCLPPRKRRRCRDG